MKNPARISRLLVMSGAALLLASAATPAQAAQAHATKKAAAEETPKKAALKEGMRRLWSDHVFWTREYIVAAIDGPPEAAQAAVDRLMKNQEEIGAAVAPYYGKAAGDKLTGLLKEHIQQAAELVGAAKAGDQAKFQDLDQKWRANAKEIADFLASANPHWPRSTLEEAMNMHLSTTTNEVEARLHKDYPADVAAFDKVYDHILKMSDVLASGIIQQFPNRFAGTRNVATK